MISALGMYDFPEIQSFTDKWYNSIQIAASSLNPPQSLDRDCNELSETGKASKLFVGQTCGFPLVISSESFQVVGIPQYAVKGSHDCFYRSAVIVHKDSNIYSLQDVRDMPIRIAVNSRTSCSGCLMMAATFGKTILDLATIKYTGAHEISIRHISENICDLAAIDCVTFELLRKYRPEAVHNIRVIGYTLACPALPYVTSYQTSATDLALIQNSLTTAISLYGSEMLVSDLFIKGFRFDTSPHECSLMALYEEYIGNLQSRAQQPSSYELYVHDSPIEDPFTGFRSVEPMICPVQTLGPVDTSIATVTTTATSAAIDLGMLRNYLLSKQPMDARYIADILHAIKLDATSAIHDTLGSQTNGNKRELVWTDFSIDMKKLRIVYPGGRRQATDFFHRLESANIEPDCAGSKDPSAGATGSNIVCFMGTRKAVQNCSYHDIAVVRDCWAEDANIVDQLNPDVILAYASGEVQVCCCYNCCCMSLL